MSEFYAAVLAAQPQPVDGGMFLWRLSSPFDASKSLDWPMLQCRVLLERDFYARFFTEKKWLGSLPPGGPQCKLVVLGQPGIGKTAFGWWLIAQLLRSGRTVVYSRNSAKRGTPVDEAHFVFHRGVALETLAPFVNAASNLLSDPSVVHICDSRKPTLDGRCHKIMLTSPDPDLWRWFVEKEYADTAYFPLYSDAELEVLRAAEFGEALSKDVLALRRKAWGNVPRPVFSTKQSAVRVGILNALKNADLVVLQRAQIEVETSMSRPSDETSHSLFLLHADRDTLKAGSVSFRSEAVGLRVLQKLAADRSDVLLRSIQQLLESRTTKGILPAAFLRSLLLTVFLAAQRCLVAALMYQRRRMEKSGCLKRRERTQRMRCQ
jgi:hypothetical protein